MPEIARILVPIDFSDCSRAALEYAALLHERLDSQVHLLHVYYSPHEAGQHILVNVPDEGSMTLEALCQSQAERELGTFLADGRGPHLEAFETHLVSGNPYRRILEFAESGRYDLIVMGTHGRTGLTHLLMGSVAEKVIRHAPCPVLSIRG